MSEIKSISKDAILIENINDSEVNLKLIHKTKMNRHETSTSSKNCGQSWHLTVRK